MFRLVVVMDSQHIHDFPRIKVLQPITSSGTHQWRSVQLCQPIKCGIISFFDDSVGSPPFVTKLGMSILLERIVIQKYEVPFSQLQADWTKSLVLIKVDFVAFSRIPEIDCSKCLGYSTMIQLLHPR